MILCGRFRVDGEIAKVPPETPIATSPTTSLSLAYAELNNPTITTVQSSSSFMFIWASLDLI